MGAPVDVLDHCFGAGPALTVGVEEEFMLLDRESLDLVQRIEDILASEKRGEFAELVTEELFESLIELHTPVCTTVAEAERQLRRLRVHGLAIAAAAGLRLGAAGTHPFSLFERQHVTVRDRYRALVDDLQYAARRELVFGMHVHVAVDDPDRAVRIVSALQAHLGELVALSASSPFWRGEPTGLASCRHLIFSAFPRSGPPPQFRNYEEFAAVVAELVACGCIEDYTRTWWDVRLHPRFGTIEVRVMDAVSRVEDAVALTAYVQALVAHYDAADQAGETLPLRHSVLTNENKWRAARYGLRATVIDLAQGGPIPITGLIERTLHEISPDARAIGCDRELEGVRRIMRDGNGADRQLAVYAATGDPRAVARDIANVTQGGE